jgi:hypothetical protein
MRQAWHIFQKDVRHLRAEIAIYLATILAASYWTMPNMSVDDWVLMFGAGYSAHFAELLHLMAGAYLIARLIHAEALAGNRQFWITRPYRRSSLVAAKLGFIFVWVDLPILISQWLILMKIHVPATVLWPGLLWEQMLWLFGIWFPLAALAALTPGMVIYLASALGLAVATFLVAQNGRDAARSLHSTEWVRASMAFMFAWLASAAVLFLQYAKRQTVRNALLAAGATSAGILAYIFLPWNLAFGIQQRLSAEHLDPSVLSVKLDTSGNKWARALVKTADVQLVMPLVVSGIPQGEQARLERLELSLQEATGHFRVTNILRPGTSPSQSRELNLNVDAELDRGFFDADRERRVTLRGSLALTLLGKKQTVTLPARPIGESTAVTDRLRCQSGANGMVCGSPFRWPNQWISVIDPDSGKHTPLTYAMSSSPFPASLQFFPWETRWGPLAADRARAFAVEILEPVSYVRRDFEIRNVYLTDIAVPVQSKVVLREGKTVVETEY